MIGLNYGSIDYDGKLNKQADQIVIVEFDERVMQKGIIQNNVDLGRKSV